MERFFNRPLTITTQAVWQRRPSAGKQYSGKSKGKVGSSGKGGKKATPKKMGGANNNKHFKVLSLEVIQGDLLSGQHPLKGKTAVVSTVKPVVLLGPSHPSKHEVDQIDNIFECYASSNGSEENCTPLNHFRCLLPQLCKTSTGLPKETVLEPTLILFEAYGGGVMKSYRWIILPTQNISD